MEAISLSRAEGFIEPYLKGIEAATKMELRFSVTKEKNKKNTNICFVDVMRQTKTQRVDSHECVLLFTTVQHQTFKFPVSNFRLRVTYTKLYCTSH